ncbi:MAG: DUF2304 domain-containing protein [Oscillospiraceae bacterium]
MGMLLDKEIRIFLILGSIITFMFLVRYIRKSRVRIEDTFFWVLFSAVLIVISIFPQIAFVMSAILKIQSPINFVFLLTIFVLIIHQFYMTMKMSQLQIKFKELVQQMALNEKDKK